MRALCAGEITMSCSSARFGIVTQKLIVRWRASWPVVLGYFVVFFGIT